MITSETLFTMSSVEVAEKVIDAIEPEMDFDSKRDRSDVEIRREGRNIYVKIKAKDVAAFRSAINTYSKLIQLSKELIENGREKRHK